jgi:hypothetical protein
MSSRDVRIVCPRPYSWRLEEAARVFVTSLVYAILNWQVLDMASAGASGTVTYFWSMTTQTEKHDATHTRHMNWTSAICIVLNITYCSNRESWHQCLLFNYVWCKFNSIPCSVNVAPGGEKIRHPNTSKHLYLMHFLYAKFWNTETVHELKSFIKEG